MFLDTSYLFMVFLPALVLSLLAQFFVSSAFNRWSKVANGSNLSGVDVAQRLMRAEGLNVGLEGSMGQLTDHYDPRAGVVRLSQPVANTNSVAAMAIVAHEFGHVQQHQENSPLIVLRNFLVPAVQFSPQIGYFLILMGFLLQITGLIWAGILLFGVVVVFMLLTLPVEIDASVRGLRMLRANGLMIAETDQSGSRQMLTAAALTYVAAFVQALLQLLYYISLANRRR
jgi:uncharacterized protein